MYRAECAVHCSDFWQLLISIGNSQICILRRCLCVCVCVCICMCVCVCIEWHCTFPLTSPAMWSRQCGVHAMRSDTEVHIKCGVHSLPICLYIASHLNVEYNHCLYAISRCLSPQCGVHSLPICRTYVGNGDRLCALRQCRKAPKDNVERGNVETVHCLYVSYVKARGNVEKGNPPKNASIALVSDKGHTTCRKIP